MGDLYRMGALLLLSACTAGPASTPDATSRMPGRWQVEPSTEDARKAEVLGLALGEVVPSAEQIAAAHLSPSEAGMVQALLAAREQDPQAPELLRMRAAMESVQAAIMEISADEMTFRLGEQTQTRTYRVTRADTQEVHLETVAPSGAVEAEVFRLEGTGDAALLIEPDGETTRLHRLSSGG